DMVWTLIKRPECVWIPRRSEIPNQQARAEFPMLTPITRRDFLSFSAAITASLAATRVASGEGISGEETGGATKLGKAEYCIFVWLGGGASQIDTWDPKNLGDPQAKKSGSYYRA